MQGNYGIESCNIIAWHLDNIVEVKSTLKNISDFALNN